MLFRSRPRERDVLGRLPETLILYRGYAHGDGQGISWTLDRRVADWFAHREAGRTGEPRVLSGEASRADVWAFCDGLEVEILIDPQNVRLKTSSPATAIGSLAPQAEYIMPPFDVSTLCVR